MIALLAGAATLGACAQETTDTTSSAGTTPATRTTTGGAATASESSETIAELQAEIDQLASAIAESEAGEDLAGAWEALGTELAAAVVSVQDDGAIAREEVEDELEQFESTLDELEVEENLRTAWEALRSHLEQLLS
jgi:hypothetical protein